MKRSVIFLNGPIGAGKTSLGRALAGRLDGVFVDGDDHASPDRPWFASILSTSRAILAAATEALDRQSVAVVAYPLRCTNWIYFRGRLAERGVLSVFVGLRASHADVTAPGRGRIFDAAESERIRAMISEGYGTQSFNDVIVDTGSTTFASALAILEEKVLPLIAGQ